MVACCTVHSVGTEGMFAFAASTWEALRDGAASGWLAGGWCVALQVGPGVGNESSAAFAAPRFDFGEPMPSHSRSHKTKALPDQPTAVARHVTRNATCPAGYCRL